MAAVESISIRRNLSRSGSSSQQVQPSKDLLELLSLAGLRTCHSSRLELAVDGRAALGVQVVPGQQEVKAGGLVVNESSVKVDHIIASESMHSIIFAMDHTFLQLPT